MIRIAVAASPVASRMSRRFFRDRRCVADAVATGVESTITSSSTSATCTSRMMSKPFTTNGNRWGKNFQQNRNNVHWLSTTAMAGAIIGAIVLHEQEHGINKTTTKLESHSNFEAMPLATSTTMQHSATSFIDNHNNSGVITPRLSIKKRRPRNDMKNPLIDKEEALEDNKESEDDNSRSDIRVLNKALQQNHERKKVVLGRLLTELRNLGEEVLAAEKSTGASHDQSTSKEVEEHKPSNLNDVQHSYVEITEEDLSKLSPADAWRYINCLKDGAVFNRKDVKRLAIAASEVLRKEPTLIDLRERRNELKTLTIVGDIHGQFSSLFNVLEVLHGRDNKSTDKKRTVCPDDAKTLGTPWDGSGAVVFNGDFVDRGENSLEVMLSLLLLKLAHPNHVFLNRGNHEDSVLSTVYGYSEELQSRYGDEDVDDIWESFSDVFASLPLCVRTDHAAIMHGGLPSDNFHLSELEQITPEQRFKMKTLMEPEDDKVCQLVQNILWSDPRPDDGIEPNEDRGAGMQFGPDVLRRFLSSNGLRHLFRSHEPVDAGYEKLECSDNQSAVTVFSAASYPAGEGFNWGAVIRLHSDGTLEPITFEEEKPSKVEEEKRTFRALAELIFQHQQQLEDEFTYMSQMNSERRKLQSSFSCNSTKENGESTTCMITRRQWAEAMSVVLDVHNIDWLTLQPYLAPTTLKSEELEERNSIRKTKDTGMIDYRRFLDLHCNIVTGTPDESKHQVDAASLEVLHRNRAALLIVFKFLDTDKNGQVDRVEFNRGISLLSKRMPDTSFLGGQTADELFNSLDLDGNGSIDLDEFEKVFQSVEMPYAVAVFKAFDTDNSGTIDRDEFREGVRMLNARLSNKEQIKDADVLFDQVDVDKSGEIDLDEFRRAVEDFFP